MPRQNNEQLASPSVGPTEEPSKPFRTKNRLGVPGRISSEARAMARKFISSAKYRKSLKQRILDGHAQQLEIVLWHYAYGKPREQDATPAALIQINMPGVDGRSGPLPEVLMLPKEAKVLEDDEDA